MIRLWNYNKNRIHSYRGARYIEMSLDSPSNLIFRGEIKRALGAVMEPEACSECILFTMKDSILNLIERYDPIAVAERENERKQSSLNSFLINAPAVEISSHYDRSKVSENTTTSRSRHVSFSGLSRNHRGATLSPTRGREVGGPGDLSRHSANIGGWESSSERPLTGKKKGSSAAPSSSIQKLSKLANDNFEKNRFKDTECPMSMSYDCIPDRLISENRQWNAMDTLAGSPCTRRMTSFVRPSTAAASRNHQPLYVSTIELLLISNWGDCDGIGLTGLSALDDNFQAITLPIPSVVYKEKNGVVSETQPTMMSSSPAVLLNNENLTNDFNHMWYTLYSFGKVISILFDMSNHNPVPLRGLNIWNYNGSGEEACKGAKHIEIVINGSRVIPAVLRKALGVDSNCFEYAQFIHLTDSNKKANVMRRHKSTQHLDTVLDSTSPTVTKSETRQITSKTSNESSPNSAVDPLLSPVEDVLDLDGRFSPIFGTNNVMSTERGNSCVEESLPTSNVEYITKTCMIPQQYETPVRIFYSYDKKSLVITFSTYHQLFPCGCMLKIVILSSHGDPHYVGLNGINIFDNNGNLVEVSDDQLQASPFRDVNDLPEIKTRGRDARCLENLIHPENDTFNDAYVCDTNLCISNKAVIKLGLCG